MNDKPFVRSTFTIPFVTEGRSQFPCFARYILDNDNSGAIVLFVNPREGTVVFSPPKRPGLVGEQWNQTVSVYKCQQAWEILPPGTKIQLELL